MGCVVLRRRVHLSDGRAEFFNAALVRTELRCCPTLRRKFGSNSDWMSKSKRPLKRCRSVKVGCTVQNQAAGDVLVPMIRLRGLWLEHAGFDAGDAVDVIVSEGEIRLVCRAPLPAKTPQQGELF